jgi:hypothetical protein
MRSTPLIGIALAAFVSGLLIASGLFVFFSPHPGTVKNAVVPSAQNYAAMMCTSTKSLLPGFQHEMNLSMGRMMADMHAPGYSDNVDVDFLAMMIPHHAGDMARLVLQNGRDPATRQLAEEIIAGQTIEIESMTRRLALLHQSNTLGLTEEFPALGGTRGQ